MRPRGKGTNYSAKSSRQSIGCLRWKQDKYVSVAGQARDYTCRVFRCTIASSWAFYNQKFCPRLRYLQKRILPTVEGLLRTRLLFDNELTTKIVQEHAKNLFLLGKDYDKMEVYSADYLVDNEKLTIVAADESQHIHMYTYDPKRSYTLFAR